MLTSLHETYSLGTFRPGDILSIEDAVTSTDGRADTHLVKLDGGRSARLLTNEVFAIMRRPVQLLPAEPGTCHIWAGVDRPEDGGEYWVMTTPVIAWALCVDGEVRFVTARGVNDAGSGHYDELYIETPGGSIQGAGRDYEHPFFADRDAYRKHIVAQVEAQRALAAGAR
jgi:hypothetical protein